MSDMTIENIVEKEVERYGALVRTAIATERERNRMLFVALANAYDRALEDTKTVIPTYLHAVLELARKESAE